MHVVPYPGGVLRVAVGGRPIRRIAASLARDHAGREKRDDRRDGRGSQTHARSTHFPAGGRRDPEAIQHAVERPQVGAPVCDGHAAEVVPRRDLIPARPQFFAGLAIKGMDGRVPRVGDAPFRIRIQAAAYEWAIRFVPREVGQGLRRVLAGSVGEHHAVGDDDLFGHVHVARQPCGIQPPLSWARLLQLVGRDATHLRPAVLDRRAEGATHRSPERNEHPLHAARILPGRHGSPHAFRIESLIVVAQQRRGVERRAVVLAAERLAIEQPHPAFLARADQELPSTVVEGHRRDVHVQIAGPHPIGVARREVVDELQLLVGVELGGDNGVAEAAGLGVEQRVAGHHVHDALRRNGRAATTPHAAASRMERARLARRQVVRVHRVRNAAAALRRGRVDDALDDVQRIGLAVGRHELLGGRDVRAVGRVDLAEPPVPADRVNRVLARRHLFHRRIRRLAAQAERVVDRARWRVRTCSRTASSRAARRWRRRCRTSRPRCRRRSRSLACRAPWSRSPR